MTTYKLDFEFNDGSSDIIESSDIDFILNEFEELKDFNSCIWARVTEQYIYGGICQGENILLEFKR